MCHILVHLWVQNFPWLIITDQNNTLRLPCLLRETWRRLKESMILELPPSHARSYLWLWVIIKILRLPIEEYVLISSMLDCFGRDAG